MNIKKFVNDINNQPYVMLEGEIVYDYRSTLKVYNFLKNFNSDFDKFVDYTSLKEKMEIAYFLRNGKYKKIIKNYITELDKVINIGGLHEHLVSMILSDYVGVDVRGLITISPFVGAMHKQIDILKLEKRLIDDFKALLFNDNCFDLKQSQMFRKLFFGGK